MRILFFGTPEFAVPSLKILLDHGQALVGVITAPDKPSGRGLQPHASAVKKFALENDLNLMQPKNLKDEDFLKELQSLKPELSVVVAFRKLPEAVWALPTHGTFNLHASLLPQYRGAAPINWAIINGETETGLTTFFISHEVDTGDLILQQKIQIGKDTTAGELHDQMKALGADLVWQTVLQIAAGISKTREQPFSETLKPAPKIFSETCRINWNQPAAVVHNHIRGLSPSPGAFTTLDGKIMKIYRSLKTGLATRAAPGTISTEPVAGLRFACTDEWLQITDLQMEAKKRTSAALFLRGFRPLRESILPTKTDGNPGLI